MPENIKELRNQYQQWLTRHQPLLGFEDGDGDDGGAGAGSGSTGDADGSGNDSDKEDEKDEVDSGDGNDEGSGDGSAIEAHVADLEKQLKTLNGKLTAAEQAAVKAKQDLKKAKEENDSKQGNWKQVAEDRAAERDDANEALAKAETERDEAKAELNKFQRTIRVTNIATRMGYKDPEDAMSLLRAEEEKLRASGTPEDESDLTGSDNAAERALRKLADKKKYLVDPQKATGKPMNGGGGRVSSLTTDAIKNMTPQEAAGRQQEIDEFMRSQFGGG